MCRVLSGLLASVVVVLVFTGCTTPPSQPAGEDAEQAFPTGQVWVWSATDQPGRYTLELLEDGSFVFRADCNTGGGNYTLTDGKLGLGAGPMTQAACPAGSRADEFVAALGQVRGFAVDGDRLTLQAEDGAELLVMQARKPLSLPGTSWVVRAYNNGNQAVVSVIQGSRLTVQFTADGTLAGSAGCNDFTSSYEVDGESIRLGPAAATRKMCAGPEGVMEQEATFLAALSTVARLDPRGERLQLRTEEGSLAVDLVSAVTGMVVHRVRRALPPEAEIAIELQDVSLADVPAQVLSRQAFAAGGKQVPFAFELPFDPAEIRPGHTYAVRATIHVGDKLLMTSTRSYPVITREAPTLDVEIEVDPVP